MKTLNEGKEVKEMMLYHGTCKTPPSIIYDDKEESFNINYSRENCYLGRGTYFALLPAYSHNYSYDIKNETAKHAMFYCSVLVGESQKVEKIDAVSKAMRETNFKNKEKKLRFESSTAFTNGSTIYTVYKNRRAYYSYLIKYWSINSYFHNSLPKKLDAHLFFQIFVFNFSISP